MDLEVVEVAIDVVDAHDLHAPRDAPAQAGALVAREVEAA
jgi:hypothetical protein